MEIFEPFLDLNNLKFVGKSNGMHEFSSKQLFITVSYFVYYEESLLGGESNN